MGNDGAMTRDLWERWCAAVACDPTGADHTGARAAFDDLLARYAEPHRHYHTIEHLGEVLALLEEVVDEVRPPHADAVRLAAWFHDAVYDPRARDNEAASAQLARRVLGGIGLPATTVDEVARLVELTADHVADRSDLDAAILLDADLSILGSPADRYDRYARDIRAEYAHVAGDDYRRGRLAVLEGFLARDHLYLTDAVHRDLDERARANLRREITALGG